ncbi:MAG: M28 family peptidase [Desulfobacterales bacterium]|nr:M28 family peptidase [Desulfobacterales bacterium]MDJ0883942.1 M28 family peptidase [Desulfobacterales bacterium]
MTAFVIKTIGLLIVLCLAGTVVLRLLVVRPPAGTRPDTKEVAPHIAREANLRAHVRMLSEALVPRSWRHRANLKRAADYIADNLRQNGAHVEIQSFHAAGNTYDNILAAFGPDREPWIVVGAHYDVAGDGPGADDNASAVAGLLELGRLLGAQPPSRRVLLAAYCLEEPPFFGTSEMGSAVHARSLKRDGRQIELMICLEMIGYFSDEPGSQGFPFPLLRLFYPSRGNFIMVVDRMISTHGPRIRDAMQPATPLPVYSINAPSFLWGIGLSDHRNFWKNGFDAVMITDTAFYRNRAYHTSGDTADRLDYARMARVVDGLFLCMPTQSSEASPHTP